MRITFKGNLTKNFSIEEYATGNPAGSEIVLTRQAYTHARMLQRLRKRLKMPIYVTSWFRTPAYNRSIGGISTSNHLKGTATDVNFGKKLTKKEKIEIATEWVKICKEFKVVGEAGFYPWGIHLGSHVTNNSRFFHWSYDNKGRRKDQPYKELRRL